MDKPPEDEAKKPNLRLVEPPEARQKRIRKAINKSNVLGRPHTSEELLTDYHIIRGEFLAACELFSKAMGGADDKETREALTKCKQLGINASALSNWHKSLHPATIPTVDGARVAKPPTDPDDPKAGGVKAAIFRR